MSTRVCVGGATGWTGSCVVRAVLQSEDFHLTGAVARQAAGMKIGTDIRIADNLADALAGPTDVYIDYTQPGVVLQHVMTAISRGVAVVIGTSGLTAKEYREIDAAARANSTGVVAAGNFSVTAALLNILPVSPPDTFRTGRSWIMPHLASRMPRAGRSRNLRRLLAMWPRTGCRSRLKKPSAIGLREAHP